MKSYAVTASAAVLASIAVAGTAIAADLGGSIRDPEPYYAPPVAAAFSWSGFYLGLQTGYVWGQGDHSFSDFSLAGSSDPSGWIGGGYGGYNWQSGNVVFGLEADIEGGDVNGSFVTGNAIGAADLNWEGSLRGRLGIAADRTLFYVTGGWAFGDVDVSGATLNGIGSTSANLDGWTLGGGIEYAFSPNFTVRTEYRYTDFGTVTGQLTNGVTMPVDLQSSAIRVGAGWKF